MVLDHGKIIEYDKTENLLSNEKSNFYNLVKMIN